MQKRSYITTAIDYPNAAPHMGHVLEKVLADACARYLRLRGDAVRFQTGTDEHGIKIQQTATKAGLTAKELVEQNVPLFKALYDELGISYDCFVRTSDQGTHWPTVQALWKKLSAAGDLEKRTYAGLYCTGCERFITQKDLVDGKCEIHLREPEKISEENWFFLMSKYQDWLKELLTSGAYKITPEFRAPETLQLIEQGLEDVSFSRPKTSLAWGVPVPGEEDTQTMYVWCDALTNYISTLGLLTDNKGAEWWNEADVTHVIGKDIARFHALIWPAMLKSAGLQVPPPQRLLIHGFLTSEGQKMSKSLGNVVVPAEAIAKYGVDPLRFYLSHEIPVGNDGDFSWKRFAELYDSKLRNQLGNLLNRVLVLLQKSGGGLASAIAPGAAGPIVAEQWGIYRTASDAFDTHRAIAAAMHVVEQLNGQMQTVQPWTKPVEEQREILSGFAEALRHVALMLLPFMPTTAQRISAQLGVPYADRMLEKSFTFGSLAEWGKAGDWTTVGTPAILFPKVD
jgi:methionyl-tRNA synthetase